MKYIIKNLPAEAPIIKKLLAQEGKSTEPWQPLSFPRRRESRKTVIK